MIRFIFWTVLLFNLNLTALNAANDFKKFIIKTQNYYKDQTSFEVAFIQKLERTQPFPDIRESKGVFYFKRPNLVRWNMENEKKHYISDGKSYYIHDLKTKKTEQHALSANSDIVPLFFSFDKLKEKFSIAAGKQLKQEVLVNLKPLTKEFPSILKVSLALDKTNYLFRRIDIFFQNGNIAHFEFKKVIPKPLEASLFKPPK